MSLTMAIGARQPMSQHDRRDSSVFPVSGFGTSARLEGIFDVSVSGDEGNERKDRSTRLVQTAVRVAAILGSRSDAFVGALGLVAGWYRLARSPTIALIANFILQRSLPMTPTKLVTTIALLLSLGACANGAGQKQIGGTLLGGALGALAGSQIGSGRGQLAAVALGALGGAFLGSKVGKSLDRTDRLSMQRTPQQALETNRTGATATWNNSDSGHSGTVTPTQTFLTASGQQLPSR